jgi:ABC-type polysaccharide transport system permease subunit
VLDSAKVDGATFFQRFRLVVVPMILPILLVGGAGQLKGGRHLPYPIDTPMSNLLVSMLDKVGVSVERLGDSTGRLDLEHISGV